MNLKPYQRTSRALRDPVKRLTTQLPGQLTEPSNRTPSCEIDNNYLLLWVKVQGDHWGVMKMVTAPWDEPFLLTLQSLTVTLQLHGEKQRSLVSLGLSSSELYASPLVSERWLALRVSESTLWCNGSWPQWWKICLWISLACAGRPSSQDNIINIFEIYAEVYDLHFI